MDEVEAGADGPESKKPPALPGASSRAGDRDRTGDIKLGKLAFYH
jgi:hypothetical protein